MNDQPPCFVINLDGATARWAHIEREFGQAGLAPLRFAARTSADVSPELVEWRLEDFLADGWTRGEVGCLMSHMAIWRHIVDAGLPFAVVFEDDIVLGKGAGRIITSLQFPIEPTIKKLETSYQPCYVSRRPLSGEKDGARFYRLISQHKGAAAYALNAEAAQELLHRMTTSPSRADELPFTPAMLNGAIAIEQLVPAIATQLTYIDESTHYTELGSTLSDERLQNNLKIKRALFPRMRSLSLRYIYNIIYKLKGIKITAGFIDRNGQHIYY